jgi:ribosomal protein L21E
MKTKQVLSVTVSTLALVALAATPALAKDNKKDSKKSQTHASASAAAAASGAQVSNPGPAPKPGMHDTKPGPAWKTVGGTVKSINGDIYTVEDYEGNQVQLYVGQGTKHLKPKKVGDTVRAEITRGGFANSIQ